MLPYDKSAALILLPALGSGKLRDPDLRRWLARGRASIDAARGDKLRRVLDCLNLPYPQQGIAALRMWGQTGERPGAWIAAADPVYLEARLDHVLLHALTGEAMPGGELHEIFDTLQERLAGKDRYGFARIDTCGYVRASAPLPTASLPATAIDGQLPNEYLPVSDNTSSHLALRGELEMVLHDHAVNVRRESRGLPPVNSLWLWGGGFAPQQATEPRPPLFADDALLRGDWLSKTALVEAWPGSVAACLDAAVAGFVAVPTPDPEDPDWLQRCLGELRHPLRSGRISGITLLLNSGRRLTLRKSDAWKFWRRNFTSIDAAN